MGKEHLVPLKQEQEKEIRFSRGKIFTLYLKLSILSTSFLLLPFLFLFTILSETQTTGFPVQLTHFHRHTQTAAPFRCVMRGDTNRAAPAESRPCV